MLRFVASAAVIVVCATLKAPLDQLAGSALPPFITFYPAIVAVAVISGTAAALASVPVTAAIAWFFWLAPVGSFGIPGRHAMVGLLLYIGVATAVALIVGRVSHLQDRFRRQSAFLRMMLDSSKGCIAVVEGDDLRFRLVNRAFEALRPETPMLGRSLRDVFDGGAATLEPDIARVLATGAAHQSPGLVIPAPGRPDATYDLHIARLPHVPGEPPTAMLVAWDTTEHARAEHALKESEQRLAELAESMPQLVWRAADDGRIDYYNSRLALYVGAERLATGEWTWEGLIHPDDLKATREAWRAAVRGRLEFQTMQRLRMADGSWRWHLSRARPVRAPDDVVHWYGTATDIHDRMEAEEKVHVLLAEVNHRAKNMLALVQAVARQTVKGDPQDFLQRFESRVQALAASQDLLVSAGWDGIDLADLVRAQLAHFADLVGTRITLTGPPVALKSAAAQSLGMALHELSTNAGKYGALSGSEGTVEIRWSLGDGGQTLELVWAEHGGPTVSEPARRGFGSVVIGRMVEAALGGRVETRYDAAGLTWRLVCSGERALGKAAHRTAEVDEAARSSTEAAPRVLVVEDEALVALEIAGVLADAGFTVLGPAASVATALGVLAHERCDVAVLDVNLGAETSEPIATRLIADGVPFVTMSGYSRSQRPKVFGGSPFLGKPLTRPELLVAELHASLAGRSGGRGATPSTTLARGSSAVRAEAVPPPTAAA